MNAPLLFHPEARLSLLVAVPEGWGRTVGRIPVPDWHTAAGLLGRAPEEWYRLAVREEWPEGAPLSADTYGSLYRVALSEAIEDEEQQERAALDGLYWIGIALDAECAGLRVDVRIEGRKRPSAWVAVRADRVQGTYREALERIQAAVRNVLGVRR